jgi:hypothetical protein
MKEESIFQEAERIIYGDREQTYGKPDKNLLTIANYWNIHIKAKYGTSVGLTAEDVCVMMALLKLAREANKHGRDNLVDMIGYVGLIQRVLDSQNAPDPQNQNHQCPG